MSKITAADIPCYAIYSTDSHYSDTWGNKLVALWIATKRAFARGEIKPENFRDELAGGIINEADWLSDFRQAAIEVGADPDDDVLFEEYVSLHKGRAFDLIPTGLHAEFCWVPEWDGANLDDLLETLGLRSDRWNSSYIEDIRPGNWLAVFLRMVNQSSEALIAACIEKDGDNGRAFERKCAANNFVVGKDDNRPSLMTPGEVISAIENAYSLAVPCFHCEINVRALFEHDPTKAMRMTSVKGKVHLGLHEFINGAGYMDTYPGEIAIPADATGFAGVDRWRYGIDKVYGIVKSQFYTTPIAIPDVTENK